jgi:hypothetical protein
MPTIESKKYGNTQYITADAWELFKKQGRDRHFKIIDDSDIKDTVIPTPETIVDFSQAQDLTKPVEDTVQPIIDRQEIKDELDELGVEYNTRTSTENLLKLLEEKRK